MSTIEKVTYRPPVGRARSVTLEAIEDAVLHDEPYIRGVEVDSHGVRKDPSQAYLRKHGGKYGEIVHLIPVESIEAREPTVVDYRYGTLVPAGTSTQECGDV